MLSLQHLGHFLLTNLLLPKLRQTALEEKYPSKVITLSSSLYTRAYRQCSNQSNAKKMQFGIDLDDLQCKHKRYTLFDQYSQSKLANILFARELGRREQSRARKLYQQQQPLHSTENDANDNHIFCPIQSYAVHPGLVRTNVVRDMPWYLYYPNIVFAIFMAVLQKTPKSGAYTSTFCAVVDDFRGEGIDMEARYYVNSEVSELSQAARSHEVSQEINLFYRCA
jgi:retinol dehydrogenase-13